MQTFLPYADFRRSAASLDDKRLGKQRVECLQILRALSWAHYGWKNHPATKMWRGYKNALVAYGVAICDEWIRRGYNDSCRSKILCHDCNETGVPPWLGDERLHASHRSNLVRKDAAFYGPQFPDADPSQEYYWPENFREKVK